MGTANHKSTNIRFVGTGLAVNIWPVDELLSLSRAVISQSMATIQWLLFN